MDTAKVIHFSLPHPSRIHIIPIFPERPKHASQGSQYALNCLVTRSALTDLVHIAVKRLAEGPPRLVFRRSSPSGHRNGFQNTNAAANARIDYVAGLMACLVAPAGQDTPCYSQNQSKTQSRLSSSYSQQIQQNRETVQEQLSNA
jgi:hypothetical protein